MLWRESLDSSLAQLEKEEYVVELALHNSALHVKLIHRNAIQLQNKVLEARTSEWAARLQTLLDALISLQVHLLPGSAVVEREDVSELSEEEKRNPNYLVPHYLNSLEKGLGLMRLTIDSKLETQFLLRKQLKDECDSIRSELEKAQQIQVQVEEARRERRQLRDELKQLKTLYDAQNNDLMAQTHAAQAQCSKYKAQAGEYERFAHACEKEVSMACTRMQLLEAERDSARACTLETRAQLLKEEDARSKLLVELTKCNQKLTEAETQREALLLTKIPEITSKSTQYRPAITSPTLDSTSVSPSYHIVNYHSSPSLSHSHLPALSHHPPTLYPIPTPLLISQPSSVTSSPTIPKHDVANLHSYLLRSDALHKGSLRNSSSSLYTETSLAVDEEMADLKLTEQLLRAKLASLGPL